MSDVVKSAEPKGHHYVSAMYLRGFTGAKGQLLAIDRANNKWFRTSPDNVAKKRHFNRSDLPGMHPNAIEKALSEFEGEVAPALERIKAAKSLATEADRSLLVNLMAALALRNPRRREDIGKIISLAKLSAVRRASAKDKGELVDGFMKAARLQGADEKRSLMSMIDAIKEDDLKASKEEIMVAEIDHHDRLAERLWHRKWQMLVAADDAGGFVTTDDPVCLRWTDGLPHGGISPGFAMAATEVIFPISTKIALRGAFEGEENVIDADTAMVAGLNSLIISNAENQVYAHDHIFKFKRREPDDLGSGATLLEDEDFMAAGKPRPGGIVVPFSEGSGRPDQEGGSGNDRPRRDRPHES
jgi:hypothetical protein